MSLEKVNFLLSDMAWPVMCLEAILNQTQKLILV